MRTRFKLLAASNAGRAARAERVEQGGTRLVIIAAGLGELLAEISHRVVEHLDVGQEPQRLGDASAQTTAAEVRRSLAAAGCLEPTGAGDFR